jgi:hypothetical protein
MEWITAMKIDAAYDIARKAITNVLAGRTADGAAPLGTAIPFPRNEDMQFKAAIKLAQLIIHLGAIADDKALTQLTTKLLAHMAKQGYLDLGAQYPLTDLVKALRENPKLIGSRAGFARILAQQRVALTNILTAPAAAPVTPRRVLWQDPPFALTEVTHPRHLREDGLALRHCTANLYDLDLIAGLERPPTPREKLFALSYWRDIEGGRLRMLTLMEEGEPRLTIEYNTALQRITHIQGRRRLEHDSPLLQPLCRALTHFRRATPVRGISGLPKPSLPNTVLTAEGIFAPASMATVRTALTACVAPGRRCSLPELKALARMSHIALLVTWLDERHLARLTDVAGSLHTDQPFVLFPRLRRVGGDLFCVSGVSVECPRLENIGGSNVCRKAEVIHQPALRAIGRHNLCSSALRIHQPALEAVSGLNNYPDDAEVVQPALRGARYRNGNCADAALLQPREVDAVFLRPRRSKQLKGGERHAHRLVRDRDHAKTP